VLLAVAFLLIVSLAISACISSIQSLWSVTAASWAPFLETINFAVSFLIISALFALLFRLLPRATIAWGDVVIGAIVTALLFNIGKFLIGFYIAKTAITSGFGAAGSIIAMVIWVYYSAQIFLLGAEFTWVYAKRFGSRSHFPGEKGTKP
jgi:membrane protein